LTVFDPNSPEFTRRTPTPTPRETSRTQLFVTRHSTFFVLAGILVAQLLLLSIQITRANNDRLIRIWAVSAFAPFERVLRASVEGAAHSWTRLHELWRAQQQNDELQTELVAARNEIQQLTEQASEARRLRALLDFKSRLPFQTVAAEVIAASPGPSSNAILIDKGRDTGLTADLAVITLEGIVGKTIAVFPHTSQVLLISDPDSGVGCILEKTRVQGVLKGSRDNLGRVHYIMNEEPVSVNELVLTSGLDQVYPKGLPVGKVIGVGDGNIYKEILVKPSAPLNRLESVLVILKPSSAQEQALNLPHRP
jgi:rod shape-determining protein MreC